MFDMGELMGYAFIAAIAAVVLFLILREVICWYWKINQQITVLRDNQSKLDRQIAVLQEIRDAISAPPVPVGDSSQDPTRAA